MSKKVTALVLGFAATWLALSTHAAVTDAQLRDARTQTSDVLTWGVTLNGQRYSTLDKVNTSNVQRLVPVWSMSFGGEKQRG